MRKHSLYQYYTRILLNRGGRKGNLAMFHAARCGSTVIGDLLDQHPEVSWAREIFNTITKDYIRPDWIKEPIRKTILWHLYKTRCSYAGFETTIMPSQQLGPGSIGMTMEEYIRLLDEVGITHYVILRRENQLKRCLSAQVARVKKQGHSRIPVTEPTPVKLDVEKAIIGNSSMPLLELFSQVDQRYDLLVSLLSAKKTITVKYEEDVQDDPLVAYYKLCDFLEIEKIPVQAIYQRTNPFPLRQAIRNYDEVAGLLTGTRYEWMLQD